MLDVEKIYIVHYTRLIERKMHMDAFFRANDIDVEYILKYDKDDLTKSEIDEYYLQSKEDYDERILGIFGPNGDGFRELAAAEVSCTIKHYNAIKKLGEECAEYGLIFEDDIMFVENFSKLFNLYLNKTPDDWDAIFFGSCCGLDVGNRLKDHNKVAYLKEHPASKCADGYLLKTDLAKKITNTMKPFVTISDWELGYQLALHDAKVYWWSPPLIRQGSEHGLFKTTLR